MFSVERDLHESERGSCIGVKGWCLKGGNSQYYFNSLVAFGLEGDAFQRKGLVAIRTLIYKVKKQLFSAFSFQNLSL
jgi:hypothetical protein